jgi:hypothetical protein
VSWRWNSKVNPRTVRRAIGKLIDDGLLTREPNGRPSVSRDSTQEGMPLRIAFLSVAYPSPHIEVWHRAVENLAVKRGFLTRSVGYSHENDPTILDTVESFDGTFFLAGQSGQVVPESVLLRIKRTGKPCVFIDQDVSHLGMPSLRLTSPVFVQRLLEHLQNLGHRDIDCLNTQIDGPIIQGRIEQWTLWQALHGGHGRLVSRPCSRFQCTRTRAYDVIVEMLRQGQLKSTALLCTTFAAALGAMRALHDHSVRIGRDVSVCCADDGAGLVHHLIPTLTALQDLNPDPYLAVAMDWIEGGGIDWKGPLNVHPADVPLFVGESTGPGPGDQRGREQQEQAPGDSCQRGRRRCSDH